MEFVWKGWQDTPISVPGNQIRVDGVLEQSSAWEETREFPERAAEVPAPNGGFYAAAKHAIVLRRNGEEKSVSDGLGHVTALACSSDAWRLYVADLTRRFIFAYSILPDGTLGAQYKLAALHLPHDCHQIGATDICVSDADRIFVATELGVQGIVSFGLADIILPLPDDAPARRVALTNDGWLYAASDDRIYRRKVKARAVVSGKCTPPATPGYGDGFDYSRPHE